MTSAILSRAISLKRAGQRVSTIAPRVITLCSKEKTVPGPREAGQNVPSHKQAAEGGQALCTGAPENLSRTLMLAWAAKS